MKTKLLTTGIFWMLMLVNLMSSGQEKPFGDTVVISVSGQKALIPLPPDGKRTSVRFENNNHYIEISVFQNKRGAPYLNQSRVDQDDRDSSIRPRKLTRWLSQIEGGYMALVQKDALIDQLLPNIDFDYHPTLRIIQNVPEQPRPKGAYASLSIFETERKLSKRGSFIYGTNFFFGRAWMDGSYSGRILLPDTTFLFDTIDFNNHYTMQQTTAGLDFPVNYRFVFPVGKKYPVYLDLGAKITARFSWLKIMNANPFSFFQVENPPTAFSMGVQPFAALTAGPVGIFGGIDLRLLSFTVNKPNNDQAFYIGLRVRPFDF